MFNVAALFLAQISHSLAIKLGILLGNIMVLLGGKTIRLHLALALNAASSRSA